MFKVKEEIEKRTDCKVVFLNPKIVLSQKQVETSILHTLRAFKDGTNVSRNMEIEFICYLFGERQIKEAKMKNKIFNETLGIVFLTKEEALSNKENKTIKRILENEGAKIERKFKGDLKEIFNEFKVKKGELERSGFSGKTLKDKTLKFLIEKVALLDILK